MAKNSAVFLTATVTGSGPQPTGEVYFYDSATPHDTISMVLNASGVASYTPDTGILGTHTITAVYSGDNNYRSETSSPLVVTVTTP